MNEFSIILIFRNSDLAYLSWTMDTKVLAVPGINHKCENSRFLVSAIHVTISSPDSLSSSEAVVDPGRS
jgi:hypothetical protein